MHYRWLVVFALLFLAPLPASAADSWQPVAQAPPQPQLQPQSQPMSPQDVEEPDSPDDDSMGAEPEEPGTPGTPVLTPEGPKPAPAPPAVPAGETYDKVVLQGLNKVTARAQTIDAPIGSVVRFGTIEIIAHTCWKSAPEERPESAALLEISEIRQGEAPQRIFLGWMFASSPGLSSLEHPFYDVTVVKCEQAEFPAAPAPKETKKKVR